MTRVLVLALLAAAALRVVASVVSGFATLASAKDFTPPGSQRTGQILTAFGSGGDTIEALLLVGALVVLWQGFAPRLSPYDTWLRILVVATVVLVGFRVAGLFAFTSSFSVGSAAAQQSVTVGFGVADVVVSFGVLAAVRLLSGPDEAADPGQDDDAVLFAVDRNTGEVFAFFSAAEARRTISAYSVEDGEFAFYDDEGRVVDAGVVDGWTRFTPTDTDERDALLVHLRRFAAAKSLEIEDPDDPLDYARPINEWQWLELWPGWTRGIGRPFARLRRP